MKEECYINGKDAYVTWGVVFGRGSLTALMSPAPLKPFTENTSRSIDGKIVSIKNPRMGERDIQLVFYIEASSFSQFMTRYNSFVDELKKGELVIKTKYQPGVLYKTIYVSCTQFLQFNGRLGKFMLKLNEPNPADRL